MGASVSVETEVADVSRRESSTERRASLWSGLVQQHSQMFETLRQKQAARPSEGGSFADVGEAEASERMSERMSGRVSSLARVFSNTSGTTQEADDGVGGASVSVETEVADVSRRESSTERRASLWSGLVQQHSQMFETL